MYFLNHCCFVIYLTQSNACLRFVLQEHADLLRVTFVGDTTIFGHTLALALLDEIVQ